MNLPTRTEAIKQFCLLQTHSDLANMYNRSMEVQVNVAQEGGKLHVYDYKGKQRNAWTDDIQTWKNFRIPYNAKTIPEYTDKVMEFDLGKYVEGVGMTGWNWEQRCSHWVAYDFDAITGHSDKHSKKLDQIELNEIITIVQEIPWVTVRKSTSGKGLHIYVYLLEIPTCNHVEHAALARAILNMLAALTGYPFINKVDVCGGNMWIWHRKMIGTDGLSLIKSGTFLETVPQNWQDHINVIVGKQKKTRPVFLSQMNTTDELFQELTGQRARVPFDNEHRRLIEWLQKENARFWVDTDHHMLVTHTCHLNDAQEHLKLRGEFKTISKGSELGNDHNCFLFPLRQGAWVVRRYTQGTAESPTWDLDEKGYTRCYFNKDLDFELLCKINNGIERAKGGYHFDFSQDAEKVLTKLGCNIILDPSMKKRKCVLCKHKSDKTKVIMTLSHEESDKPYEMNLWLKVKDSWERIFKVKIADLNEENMVPCDDLVRHLITEEGKDQGWVFKSEGIWNTEPIGHVSIALGSESYSPPEVKDILGSNVKRPWTLTNIPFEVEYPGNRRWNRDCAKLRFTPTVGDNLTYPTWQKILNHIGYSLNDSISENSWCKENGILTGADYLKLWITSMFKMPTEQLPYLFLYSEEQNTGKSSLHEALSRLMSRGYVRADQALINASGFNGELQNAVLCAIEETDLRKNREAYARIKDWVTSKNISIHIKGSTPFIAINTTHYIQCSNDKNSCPIGFGDTRIVMVKVHPLKEVIPKNKLITLLDKEAPDFLAEIYRTELPQTNDRLNIPMITTCEKQIIMDNAQSSLQTFLQEKTKSINGYNILVSDLWEKFQKHLDISELHFWSKVRVAREMPDIFPRGRVSKGPGNGNMAYGNIAWVETETTNLPKLFTVNGIFKEMLHDNSHRPSQGQGERSILQVPSQSSEVEHFKEKD